MKINQIAKPKKIKKIKKKKVLLRPINKLVKDADREMQEAGRKVYKKCDCCGRPMSCMHHWWPKSMSSYLRHHWGNVVPICNACHIQHHSGNPSIHDTIKKKYPENYFEDLEREKHKAVREGWKFNRQYLENKINMFKSL